MRRKIQLGLLFLLMIAASIAELISIGAVLPFLGALTSPDTVFGHPVAQPLVNALGLTTPEQLLAPLTIFFGLAALVAGGVRLLLSWAQTRLSYAMGADFSFGIYKRTLYQPYMVHLRRNSSQVIAGVANKADGVIYNTVIPILVIISSGVMMITILFALLAIQPKVTAAAIVSLGSIYGLVIIFSRRRMLKNSQLISEQQNRVIKVLQEALGGIRDVIIDGSQDFYCQIYRDADWRLRRAQSNIAIVSVSPRYVVEALGMALIAAIAYLLVEHSGGIDLAVPMIGALALAAQRMLPLLQQSYASWTSIRGGRASLNDALDFLEQPSPEYVNAPSSGPLLFQQEIIFSQVGLRYTEDSPLVIRQLNLKIPKRGRIGIIGATGSGKSTLLDIAMGLLIPTQGEMKVDGLTIGVKEHRAWQSHIAHVPQSIFLADASIAENIAFGIPVNQIDFARVERAARSAQIASTIEAWTDKYDTVVGERGVRLSGGQRQRIGIARALYKQADLIIFDEATSALDGETERAVMDSIKDLNSDLTMMIVAHRLTTLRDCTQIIELKNGMVSRVGTYEEIIGSTKPD